MAFTTTTLIISIIAFLAVVGAIEGFYMLYQAMNVERTTVVSKRIRSLSATGMSQEEAISLLRKRNYSEIPVINRILLSIPRSHSLDRLLLQSGTELTVFRYLLIQLSVMVLLFLLLLLATKVIWPLALAIAVIAGAFVPNAYVQSKKRERAQTISRQLPDALDFLARSLRAGNPFSAAIKQASEEMPDPLASEFVVVFDQLNYGLDLEEVLHHLATRSSSDEVNYFVTAVLIQRTTGGNLAEVLNRLAVVMRSRARVGREIRVLAAEMKFSANVLIALPFIVAAALTIMNPGYLATLTETTLGYIVIGAQLFLMLMGYIVIHRMINFRV